VHEDRLADLGITLPGPFPPHDPLEAVVVQGGTARTSGQLPRDASGHVRTGLLSVLRGAPVEVELTVAVTGV
jgi:hypothetical protein